MLTMTSYSAELIKDPFGILKGERYEFLIDIEVPEDDELYSENGLYVRVIYAIEDTRHTIVKYEIFEKSTDLYLDFDVEEDEVAQLAAFCKEHLLDADE